MGPGTVEDEELDALLIEAEVKEDFMELGMPAEEGRPAAFHAGRSNEARTKEEGSAGRIPIGKQYRVKVVDGV